MAVTGTPVGGEPALLDQLKDRLKQLFSLGKDDLTAAEGAIADAALTSALNVIKSTLISRGATEAQVDSWFRKTEFQLDLGTFFSLMNLGKDRDDDDKHAAWAKVFDRRKELKEIEIVLTDSTVIAVAKGDKDKVRPVGVVNLKDINDNLGR